jgi:hypothetical protein
MLFKWRHLVLEVWIPQTGKVNVGWSRHVAQCCQFYDSYPESRVRSSCLVPLKMFTFTYLVKAFTSLQHRKMHFSTLLNTSTFQVTTVFRFVPYSMAFKIIKSKLKWILWSFRIVNSLIRSLYIMCISRTIQFTSHHHSWAQLKVKNIFSMLYSESV